ncbi:MAG: hypothetical protein OEY14_18740, partial [Myxococcales bacterium]|nr:hypothetical protein [Myxococcales bacterium]
RIHRLGLGASLSGVRIAADRRAPLLVFDGGCRTLTLASRSPELRALEAGYRAGKPQAEAAIDILVSHAAGVLNRAHESVTDGAEIGASLHLLRDTEEPRP